MIGSMEPEKKEQDLENATVKDLQGDGIEIVGGSGAAEDNEFGTPETEAALADTPAYEEAEAQEPSSAKATIPADPYREPPIVEVPAEPMIAAAPRAVPVARPAAFVQRPPMGPAAAPANTPDPTPTPKPAPTAAPRPAPVAAPAADTEQAPKPAATQTIDITEASFAAGGSNSSNPVSPMAATADALSREATALGMGMGTAPASAPAPILRNDPSIKPLRTFKTDAEEAVRYQNISTADIAVAEQKKREMSPTPIQYEDEKRGSPFVLIALILAIIMIAAGGGYYLFFMGKARAPKSNLPENLVVRTIIPYDSVAAVTLDPESDPVSDIASELDDAPVNIGEVYATIPLPFGTTTVIASPSAFLSKTKVPSRLVRSLSPEYMTGTYVLNRNAPFLIFKDTFFQNAYAGMLEWEDDMRNDLLKLIRVAHPQETGVSVDGDVFEDAVVANIDARILRGAAGQPILAYAFADQNTIVIATDVETLKFLLDRLLAVRVVQ
jgi:hypothetical protein